MSVGERKSRRRPPAPSAQRLEGANHIDAEDVLNRGDVERLPVGNAGERLRASAVYERIDMAPARIGCIGLLAVIPEFATSTCTSMFSRTPPGTRLSKLSLVLQSLNR